MYGRWEKGKREAEFSRGGGIAKQQLQGKPARRRLRRLLRGIPGIE